MPASRAFDRLSFALADPKTCVLLWSFAVEGRLNTDLLALIGLRDVDADLLEDIYASQLADLRALHRGSRLFNNDDLRRMAHSHVMHLVTRGALDESLDGIRSSQRAMQAVRRMPLWMRDPELDELERLARREAASVRLLEVHTRRDELLARRAAAQAALSSLPQAAPSSQAQAAPASVPQAELSSQADAEAQALSPPDSPADSPAQAQDPLQTPVQAQAPKQAPTPEQTHTRAVGVDSEHDAQEPEDGAGGQSGHEAAASGSNTSSAEQKVKESAVDSAKKAFLVSNQAPQVKFAARPGPLQPAGQGRRKAALARSLSKRVSAGGPRTSR